jgi:hypothetical protein
MLKDLGQVNNIPFKIYNISGSYVVYIMGVIKGNYKTLKDAQEYVQKGNYENSQGDKEASSRASTGSTSNGAAGPESDSPKGGALNAIGSAPVSVDSRVGEVGGDKKKRAGDNRAIKVKRVS